MRAELAGSVLNSVIQTGKTTAIETSLQPCIIEMLNSSQVSSTSLKQASAYLQNVLLAQPYISSIAICSKDRVVIRFPDIAYVESEEELFSVAMHAPALEPVPRVCESPSGRSRRVLSLLWFVDRQNSPACILVDIDMDRVAQIPELLHLYRDPTEIVLFNAQNQVVFSSDFTRFAQTLSDAEIQRANAHAAGSGLSAFFPSNSKDLLALPLIFGILAVSALCVYMQKTMLNPLQTLIDRVHSLSGQDPHALQSGFGQQIHSTLHTLDTLQESTREMMNYSLLTKLFTRVQPQDELFLLNELLKHRVFLPEHALFFAVVLRADGTSLQSESTDLATFKLKKAGRLLQWSLPSSVHCVLVQNDPSMVCGFLSVRDNEQPLLDQSLQILQQNFETWKLECNLSFTLGVSYPMDNVQNLRGAYLQALSCTDQRLILGLGRLIRPNMCAPQFSLCHSRVKTELDGLMDAILQQEDNCAERVQSFLDLLWKGNYSALTHALLDFAARLDALCIHVQLELGIQEMLNMQLGGMETQQQLFDWCMKWVTLVSRAYQQAEQRRASICMEETLQYIENHFGDADLSAQQVADAFHISPQYFSKLFNQEVQCSFPQYLSEKRLLHAYKLLSGNDAMPIQEVCQRCGYSSRTYFTASFKKRYGIPPSKVRAFHKGT